MLAKMQREMISFLGFRNNVQMRRARPPCETLKRSLNARLQDELAKMQGEMISFLGFRNNVQMRRARPPCETLKRFSLRSESLGEITFC